MGVSPLKGYSFLEASKFATNNSTNSVQLRLHTRLKPVTTLMFTAAKVSRPLDNIHQSTNCTGPIPLRGPPLEGSMDMFLDYDYLCQGNPLNRLNCHIKFALIARASPLKTYEKKEGGRFLSLPSLNQYVTCNCHCDGYTYHSHSELWTVPEGRLGD